ncbi:MAG: LysM peptidoglycan-binding domain-containing protein [Anaerolineae bacterium]
MNDLLRRLLTVMMTGALLLGVVLGSFWLAQVDDLMTVRPPGRTQPLRTPTLFPTLAPSTPSVEPTKGASSTPAPTPEIPTPTPDGSAAEPCEPPAGWVTYRVTAGDTLYTLAERSQTHIQALLQGNCLDTVPELKQGDVLYLPALAIATPTLVSTRCGPPQHWQQVVVQPGETLSTLAVRYGTTVRALQLANCLEGTLIQAGSLLYVPPVMVVPPTSPPTLTPTPSPTFVPSPTWTPTPIVISPTWTPTQMWSPTPTGTPTQAITPTVTSTATPTPTPTVTVTPTETPVLIPTWTPEPWPSDTLTPTLTPLPIVTPTATPAQPTPTYTATAQPTATQESVPTSSPTPTATSTP